MIRVRDVTKKKKKKERHRREEKVKMPSKNKRVWPLQVYLEVELEQEALE